MKINYKDTSFLGLFKTKGLSYFKNWSLFWAIVITAAIYIALSVNCKINNLIDIGKGINEPLLGASGGIFGIVIAALTVTLALFQEAMLPKLLELGLLQKYLFPFWKAVTLWSISLIVCLLMIVMESLKIYFLFKTLTMIEIFIFFYATFYTVNLTGLVIRLALQRAQIK